MGTQVPYHQESYANNGDKIVDVKTRAVLAVWVLPSCTAYGDGCLQHATCMTAIRGRRIKPMVFCRFQLLEAS
ncbi:hypothetical protein ACLOJK_012055 [Asimina triloba]